jgi:hypothetical protein
MATEWIEQQERVELKIELSERACRLAADAIYLRRLRLGLGQIADDMDEAAALLKRLEGQL